MTDARAAEKGAPVKGQQLRAIRGMNDILPEQAELWLHVESCFRRRAHLAGFGEVRTPLIEDTSLFTHQMGETTDVVEKEMYSFERHGDRLTVRPEGTAGAARAFVEHSVGHKQPITKWYYLGAMFRGERPAKGRYRQFYQAGCEIYGDPGPVCDAEIVDLLFRFFGDLGIEGLSVHVNSIGSGDTRVRYRDALHAYFSGHVAELSEDSQRRLEKNPLRILDSKDPRDQKLAEGAPPITSVLDAEDRAHLEGFTAALTALEIPFVMDPRLVRGLDYYTRTLFEVKTTAGDLGSQNTIAGGGRYDEMVQNLGGPRTPAIGFGVGLERVLIAMKSELAPKPKSPVIVASLDPAALPIALRFSRDLRELGVPTELDARDAKMKSIIRRAENLGSQLLVLFGPDEIARGEASLKDLTARTQEAMPLASALTAVRDRVAGNVLVGKQDETRVAG